MIAKEAPSVASALRRRTGILFGVALFSGVINLLALTGAIYSKHPVGTAFAA